MGFLDQILSLAGTGAVGPGHDRRATPAIGGERGTGGARAVTLSPKLQKLRDRAHEALGKLKNYRNLSAREKSVLQSALDAYNEARRETR